MIVPKRPLSSAADSKTEHVKSSPQTMRTLSFSLSGIMAVSGLVDTWMIRRCLPVIPSRLHERTSPAEGTLREKIWRRTTQEFFHVRSRGFALDEDRVRHYCSV